MPIKTAAYQTYVLPRAEYAVCAPDPHTKGLVDKVEMIQHQSARWVLGKDKRHNIHDSVTTMLQKLNWRSLERSDEQTSG